MLIANLAITLTGLALSTASGVGPSGAVVYHYGATKMSWDHAASYCASKGWRLAKLNSAVDLTALKHRFSNDGVVWIGLASAEVGSTTYQWTDCTQYGNHTRAPWAPGEPNFLDSQLCIMMKEFEFKTNDCGKDFTFLCEEILGAETCTFQAADSSVFGASERSGVFVVSTESDCQQLCLEYQEEKECIGYYYNPGKCGLYLGQVLIFPNSVLQGTSTAKIKTCYSYELIKDTALQSWDEPFSLTCESIIEFADTTETAYSAATDRLSSSSSTVTMETTIGILPTSDNLQSSNMIATSLHSTMTQTAALSSSTVQEVTSEPTKVVTSTESITVTFPRSGHVQTSTFASGPTDVPPSEESYSSDTLVLSPTTLTGSVYGKTTDSTEVPQSTASYSTEMLPVFTTTLAHPVHATTSRMVSISVPQLTASYSTEMLAVSSTTLAYPVHATTSRMVSISVPQSTASYSTEMLAVSSATLAYPVHATTSRMVSISVPQFTASYSIEMLPVSSTTLAHPVHATTSRMVSISVPQSTASYSTELLPVSSTTPVHATTSRMASTTCVCPCGSLENRTASHSKLIKELIVKKTTLSSFKRKKTSAVDDRPSANAIGNIGIVLLAVTGVLILVLDADVIARFISALFKPR